MLARRSGMLKMSWKIWKVLSGMCGIATTIPATQIMRMTRLSVDAIATVFPSSLSWWRRWFVWTTMTRMVEEQRTQIGTMKVLGYGRGAIVMKYVTYAILASILGSAIGLEHWYAAFPQDHH